MVPGGDLMLITDQESVKAYSTVTLDLVKDLQISQRVQACCTGQQMVVLGMKDGTLQIIDPSLALNQKVKLESGVQSIDLNP